jgi:acetolactate synthase-1/2/3 large subunit
VDTIFGPATVIPFDALHDDPDNRTFLVRHEQGAAHMAEGYAKVTGRAGVCTATSGPGATNLVTPIADAYMDSVPLVALTGQVGSTRVGTDAFQEADIVGITLPIVKHSYLIKDADDLPRALAEALHVAQTGRPGRCSSMSASTSGRARSRTWTTPTPRCRVTTRLTAPATPA